jgi:hypothetical protein
MIWSCSFIGTEPRISLARRSLLPGVMAKKSQRKTSKPREDELQGPPPHEPTIIRTDRERQAEEELTEPTSTSPKLSGGEGRDRYRWDAEDTPAE